MRVIPLFFCLVLLCANLVFCKDAAGPETFTLPITQPQEIREKSSLEEPALTREMFIKEEAVKEKQTFNPPVFPDRADIKERHSLFFRQGSFDYSSFGFNSSLQDISGFYYQLGVEKNKTSGEKEVFSRDYKNIIFQHQNSMSYGQNVSSFFNISEAVSLDDKRESLSGGLSWSKSGADIYSVGADVRVQRSILYEVENWEDNLYGMALRAGVSPREAYMINFEADAQKDELSSLGYDFTEKDVFYKLSVMNYLSLFDYVNIGAGYVKAGAGNYAQGRLAVPVFGTGQIYFEYKPTEELYNFRDSYLNGFRLRAYPGVIRKSYSYLFSEGLKFRLINNKAMVHLNIHHARIRNYLSWTADSEYLKPVYVENAKEKILTLSAGYDGKRWKPFWKVVYSDVIEDKTGRDIYCVPRWMLELNNSFALYGNDLSIVYSRESSGNIPVSFDIVSAEIGRELTKGFKIFARGDNLFGKEYGDRPGYLHSIPNYTMGITITF